MKVSPAQMPDVAHDKPAMSRPLDWVGMERIALPVRIEDGDAGVLQVAAQVDVFVDLHAADARGIHMSRLYLLLQTSLAQQAVSAERMQTFLQACIDSQQGISTRAKLSLAWDHLLLRRALVTDNAGWKAYPVVLEVHLDEEGMHARLRCSVEYSSTCPASAALARQLNADRFAHTFASDATLDRDDVRDWLASQQGMAATPHAQRSRVEVSVRLQGWNAELPIRRIIDAVECALGTPVQTAVKREDEQAFAEANASNLMFCEDAARCIAAVLASRSDIDRFDVTVRHLESLHPHDAVARVSGSAGR